MRQRNKQRVQVLRAMWSFNRSRLSRARASETWNCQTCPEVGWYWMRFACRVVHSARDYWHSHRDRYTDHDCPDAYPNGAGRQGRPATPADSHTGAPLQGRATDLNTYADSYRHS